MKIVYLSFPFFADCDFPLIKEFQREGHDIYVFMLLAEYLLHTTIIDINRMLPINDIIPAKEYTGLQKFSSYLNIDKLFIINKKHRKDTHPLSLYLYWKLSQTISRINPDMIIAQPFDIASLQLYRFRDKIQFVIHDPFIHTGEKFFRKRFFRWLCFRLGRKFVILNSNQKEDFCKKHKIKEERVIVNRLGTYDVLKVFTNDKWTIRPQKNNILFFGRISLYKGIDYLCKAMEKVHEAVPDATLTIAGKGQMYVSAEMYEKKKYIQVINRFIPVPEMLMLFERSSIVCCPYTDATQSGVVMTSFTFQKPVVATRVGGIENQIEDGKTGILIPPCNVDALATALIDVLRNPEFRQTMVDNIYEKYHRKHDLWRNIAQKYIEFGRKLI